MSFRKYWEDFLKGWCKTCYLHLTRQSFKRWNCTNLLSNLLQCCILHQTLNLPSF